MNKRNLIVAAGSIGVVSLLLFLAVFVSRPAAAGGFVEKPFKMETYEVVVEHRQSANCDFEEVVVTGTGTAAHLGALTLERTHCFSPPPADPPISNGYWKAVAANGDELWGSYSGVLIPTEFDDQGNPLKGTIQSPGTIEGGTGRFEGASGQTFTVADYDIVLDVGDFVTEGSISYSAASND